MGLSERDCPDIPCAVRLAVSCHVWLLTVELVALSWLRSLLTGSALGREWLFIQHLVAPLVVISLMWMEAHAVGVVVRHVLTQRGAAHR